MDTEQWDAENSEKGVTVRTCLNCYKRTPDYTGVTQKAKYPFPVLNNKL